MSYRKYLLLSNLNWFALKNFPSCAFSNYAKQISIYILIFYSVEKCVHWIFLTCWGGKLKSE